MSYTTHTGLRRSTRLSNSHSHGKVDNFEDMINTIVEKKFNYRPIDDEERRYPLRDNTRISYSSFFTVKRDEDLINLNGDLIRLDGDLVDLDEDMDNTFRHSYNLRSRRKVRFSTDL